MTTHLMTSEPLFAETHIPMPWGIIIDFNFYPEANGMFGLSVVFDTGKEYRFFMPYKLGMAYKTAIYLTGNVGYLFYDAESIYHTMDLYDLIWRDTYLFWVEPNYSIEQDFKVHALTEHIKSSKLVFDTYAEMQQYTNDILESDWWKSTGCNVICTWSTMPEKSTTVVTPFVHRYDSPKPMKDSIFVLTFYDNVHYMDKIVVLHELAHALANSTLPAGESYGHNGGFMKAFLALLSRFHKPAYREAMRVVKSLTILVQE